MTTPTVYVICDKNCKIEGMTKEQILTAIMQAVSEGTIRDVDAGFITTIKTINGPALKFFYGEQAAYNELSDEEKENLFAIITNDTTIKDLIAALEELKTEFADHVNYNEKFPLIYSHTMKTSATSTTIDLTQLTINTVYLVAFKAHYGSPLGAISSGVYIHNENGGTINFGSIHCYVGRNGKCDFKHCEGSISEDSESVKCTMSFYQMGTI